MEQLENLAIEIPKTDEFLKASKEISDFLETLTLTDEEHSQLIEKLLEYTQIVRKDAFALGVTPILKNALESDSNPIEN